MKILCRMILLAAGSAVSALSHAERLPVLQQIDLPHPYYFREMYLPQLTSGPSSLAWSPDSRELVYSMAGSLWRQRVGAGTGSGVAQQLTIAAYDYQPDWSPDGRWVVYSSYRNDAMELWILELASGAAKPLLANGAVNIERLTGEHKSELPRYYYSPYDHEINPVWTRDGRDIIYVSNRNHIYGTGGFWRTPSQTASPAAAGAA